MPSPIVWNRKPLPGRRFAPLPLTAVRPRGTLMEAVRGAPEHTADDKWARAFLLGEKRARLSAEKEIEETLSSGMPPEAGMLRALRRVYGAKPDARIPHFLLTCARALYARLLEGDRLPGREAEETPERLETLLWLYNLTGRRPALEACRVLKAQAEDWMRTLHTLPGLPVPSAAMDPAGRYVRAEGHVLAAGLKVPALQALFEGGVKNETAFSVAWAKLMRYHGAAHGLFNADSRLAGASPSRGVDTPTLSALSDALLTLCWAGEDRTPFDVLDTLRACALPAARGTQAANQLRVGGGEAVGGLAQIAQGLWMASADGGLACAGYAPCEMRWRVGGQVVRAIMETAYPLADTVRIVFFRIGEPVAFPLHLRVPAWAEHATVTVDGEEAMPAAPGFLAVSRVWKQGDALTVTLPMPVRTLRMYHQSVSVWRGPVAYALPVTEGESWALALLPERGFISETRNGGPVVRAQAVPLPAWQTRDGRPQPPPIAPQVSTGSIREIILRPYGETDARITQFPAGVAGP